MLDDLAEVLSQALSDGQFIPDNLYFYNTEIAWQLTNEAHIHEAQRLIVYSTLESYPELQSVLGMHINTGLNAPQVTREALGNWLLTRAMLLGPEHAVSELRVLLADGFLVAEEYLAISGLEVSAPIQLPGGIELVPIKDVPESIITISLTDPKWSNFKRNEKGHVIPRTVLLVASLGHSNFYSDPHVATAVLRVQHRRTPAFVPTAVEFANTCNSMLEYLHVIAAATCTAILPVAHWIAPRPNTPLWDNFSWTTYSHLTVIREFARADENVDAITTALTHWTALGASMKKHLFIPLDRLNRALAAHNMLDAAIELGVCLEALLLSDLGQNDQISLAFRLRGAWLLGRDAAERRNLLQNFNAIYSCRSSVVHSGNFPDKKLSMAGEKVAPSEFISKGARQLAAKAILNVIKRGKIPDWSQLLVGNCD